MKVFNAGTAGIAALGLGLLASAGLAKGVDAHTSSVVAQATKAPAEGTDKERIQDLRGCRGYARAIRAFNSSYNDISGIIVNIPTADSLYPKVVEIKTQLNDARITAQKRITENCPNFKG